MSFNLEAAHNAVVYTVDGNVLVRADGREQTVACEHALGLHGSGRVTFEALHPTHLLILSGAEIRNPVITQGPFIMDEPSQIDAAVVRTAEEKWGI